MSEEKWELPFSAQYQSALLGHCIKDESFFVLCKTKIQPSWFNNPKHGRIFGALQKYFTEFGHSPTSSELKCYKTIMAETETAERTALHASIDKALLDSGEIRLDNVQQELTTWYHARLYREGGTTSQSLYNKGDFTEAYRIMSEKMDLIRTTKFSNDRVVTFKNPETFLSKIQNSYADALTTGLGIFDAALSVDGTPSPALYRGDTTVLLAPSNVGKTTTMITIAMHNIKKGKKVLFYTHEGRPDDIKAKMMCCAMKMTQPELWKGLNDPQVLAKISRMSEIIDKYLLYVPYNRAGMTVEEVVADIRRKQQDLISNTGSGYDMLVSDYPAKLTTERAKGGNLQKRHMDAIVYDYYVQLALEYNWHSLVAIQTNRQGSKDNRSAERILQMEDMAECFEVAMMASSVITINRDKAANQKNRILFHVGKSRSSATGRTIVANSRFDQAITHADSLGGTWYNSDSIVSNIDYLLKTHQGKEITPADIARVNELMS